MGKFDRVWLFLTITKQFLVTELRVTNKLSIWSSKYKQEIRVKNWLKIKAIPATFFMFYDIILVWLPYSEQRRLIEASTKVSFSPFFPILKTFSFSSICNTLLQIHSSIMREESSCTCYWQHLAWTWRQVGLLLLFHPSERLVIR